MQGEIIDHGESVRKYGGKYRNIGAIEINGEIDGKQTSMCLSVALVNESITRGSTVDNGRCLGNEVPRAGVWFLK